MKDVEVEVRGQGRDGRSGQPLPDEVSREGWVLLHHMRTGRVRHPVPIDEGGPGGCQDGREDGEKRAAVSCSRFWRSWYWAGDCSVRKGASLGRGRWSWRAAPIQ